MEDNAAAIYLRVDSVLDRVRELVDEIAHKLESVLSKVPDLLSGLLGTYRAAWSAALSKVEDFYEWYSRALAEMGDPSALKDRADAWKALVGDRGMEEAEQLDDRHELLVDDSWLGQAATVYATRAPAQLEALQELGPLSGDISRVLHDLALAIQVFWLVAIAVAVDLIAGLVGIAASISTGVGAVAVPVEMAGLFLQAVGALGLASANLRRATSGTEETLENRVRFMTGWPRLVG